MSSRGACRPAALRRLLDRMAALGTERGGFLAWEHFIGFGGGSPPGMRAVVTRTLHAAKNGEAV